MLLGSASTLADSNDPWRFELGVMNYNEKDRNTGLSLGLDAELGSELTDRAFPKHAGVEHQRLGSSLPGTHETSSARGSQQ